MVEGQKEPKKQNGETQSESRLRSVEERVSLIEQDMQHQRKAGENRDQKLDHISGQLDELNTFMTSAKTGWGLFRLFVLACSAGLGALVTKLLGVLSFFK